MDRILITGGSSLLGRYLINSASYKVASTWYTNHIPNAYQMDLTNQSQVGYVFRRVKPEIIIHCAAQGDVNYAETNYRETYAVNVVGTENVLKAAQDYQAKVILISTNAVFEGTGAPYKEDDPTQPVNAYGAIKLHAESKVTDYKWDWLIIRPFLLYGWPNEGGRANWATTVFDRLGKKQVMNIVDDTYFQPTYALHCAKAIWELISQKEEIYHVACPDRVSLYEFCREVAKTVGHNVDLIQSMKSGDLKGSVARPTDSTYDLSKLKRLGIILPSLKEGLKEMAEEIV